LQQQCSCKDRKHEARKHPTKVDRTGEVQRSDSNCVSTSLAVQSRKRTWNSMAHRVYLPSVHGKQSGIRVKVPHQSTRIIFVLGLWSVILNNPLSIQMLFSVEMSRELDICCIQI
jgi:hypothetical protein